MRRYPSSSGCSVPKEAGGSPKFVSYPSMHMPRSWIPVVSRWLAFCAFGTAAFHINHCVGFLRSRGFPYGPPSCNIFGIQCRGLRTRFPSASHTPSQGSHFGSATRLLATLWLGGILTRWVTSTDFNAYRHLPTFHASLGTRSTICALLVSDPSTCPCSEVFTDSYHLYHTCLTSQAVRRNRTGILSTLPVEHPGDMGDFYLP